MFRQKLGNAWGSNRTGKASPHNANIIPGGTEPSACQKLNQSLLQVSHQIVVVFLFVLNRNVKHKIFPAMVTEMNVMFILSRWETTVKSIGIYWKLIVIKVAQSMSFVGGT